MASLTMRLTMTIRYEDLEDPTRVPDSEECEKLLRNIEQNADLVGDSNYNVDDYRCEIDLIGED